jgi:riboflavin kinase/FMN adenylyltransferase
VGGRRFDGVANLGVRPTVDGSTHSLEVHLFEFDGDLYGQVLEVEFVKQLRGERKFESLEALKEQIARDAGDALYLLRGLDELER